MSNKRSDFQNNALMLCNELRLAEMDAKKLYDTEGIDPEVTWVTLRDGIAERHGLGDNLSYLTMG